MANTSNAKTVVARKGSQSKTSSQSIVVAIADPYRRGSLALQKAAAIAERTHARITLLNCFALPYPLNAITPASSEEIIRDASVERQEQLRYLARPLLSKGIDVHCVASWDFPPHEAIVRYALKAKPDLLIAESHRHGRVSRWLLANTDWELIRTCPCPLWFVKTGGLPSPLSILAAVDPLHEHDKPAELDADILSVSKQLADRLGGRIALAHAYQGIGRDSQLLNKQLKKYIPWQDMQRPAARAKNSVNLLGERHSIAVANRFVREGDPASVLTALADEMNTDVIVMGAVSRSRLQRPFIGTTAEKIIDQVKCDVLVVKPSNFKTPVAPRSISIKSLRVARKGRGGSDRKRS